MGGAALTESDSDIVGQLEDAIKKTSVADEVNSIKVDGITVTAEKGLVLNPFPGGMYFQRFPARFGVGLDRQLQSHHGRAVLFRCRINIHHVDLHSSRSDAGTS